MRQTMTSCRSPAQAPSYPARSKNSARQWKSSRVSVDSRRFMMPHLFSEILSVSKISRINTSQSAPSKV
eukprot:436259-Pelagomonas_calceolata.AAC.1